jgi:hypothetical protein
LSLRYDRAADSIKSSDLMAGWSARGAIRCWWIAAALPDRLFTLSYFIPTMLTLIRMTPYPAPKPPRVRFDGNN